MGTTLLRMKAPVLPRRGFSFSRPAAPRVLNPRFSLLLESVLEMTRRVIERAIVIAIGLGAFGYILGYAARLRQVGSLTADQQAWAVFALGLIAAIVLLFRAARVGDVGEVGHS
jgi:hypothetical protein